MSCSGERATLPTSGLMPLATPAGCGAVCTICVQDGTLPRPSGSVARAIMQIGLRQTVERRAHGHLRYPVNVLGLVEARHLVISEHRRRMYFQTQSTSLAVKQLPRCKPSPLGQAIEW